MNGIKRLGLDKINGLGLNNNRADNFQKTLSIKFISASVDDKNYNLVFEVSQNNLKKFDATIFVEEVNATKETVVPKTKITLSKSPATRVNAWFSRDTVFYKYFWKSGTLYQATITCDGVSASTKEFRIEASDKLLKKNIDKSEENDNARFTVTYLYDSKGVYKGMLELHNDLQKTNEIVILQTATINGIINGLKDKLGTVEDYTKIARSSTVAIARITETSAKAILSHWKPIGEAAGLLYIDNKTKEVHADLSKRVNNKDGTITNIDGLDKDFYEISKKGNVIGMWHSHPLEGRPNNSWQGQVASSFDITDPFRLNNFKHWKTSLGIITQRDIITLFPIHQKNILPEKNKKDKTTTASYSSKFEKDEHNINGIYYDNMQDGSFYKNLLAKTFWED